VRILNKELEMLGKSLNNFRIFQPCDGFFFEWLQHRQQKQEPSSLLLGFCWMVAIFFGQINKVVPSM